jgi:hypothetical protein
MKQTFWSRLVSLITLTAFLFGCSNSPAVVPSTDTQQVTQPPPSPAPTFDITDSIWAKVGQKGISNGDQLPFVVIFEERHDSRRAQVEEAIMLNRLYENNGVRHLALEGAMVEQEPPSASWFHSLPNDDTKRDVALQLLEQGEISAAEFIAMVYPDFQLHPVEKESEHAVSMSNDAGIAPIGYLFSIAATSLSNDEIDKANSMSGMDAIDYIISTDSWTQERYDLINQTTPSPQIEDMVKLVDELEVKAKEVNADVSEYSAGLQELRNFYVARGNASNTMVGYASDIAAQYSSVPIAMIIGAAHTNATATLFQEKNVSYAVLSPLALIADKNVGEIYSEAYDRKLNLTSVDPTGTLGAYLDNRLKPSPVINQEWFILKAKIMYAGIVIARAAASGGDVPFDLDKDKLGITDGQIDIDLTAMEVQESLDKNGNKVYEVLFPVKLIRQNKTLWMKVIQAEPSLEAQTLEEALISIWNKLNTEEDISSDEAQQIETAHSSEDPAVVSLSVDVNAAVSDNYDAIKAVKVSG